MHAPAIPPGSGNERSLQDGLCAAHRPPSTVFDTYRGRRRASTRPFWPVDARLSPYGLSTDGLCGLLGGGAGWPRRSAQQAPDPVEAVLPHGIGEQRPLVRASVRVPPPVRGFAPAVAPAVVTAVLWVLYRHRVK